MKKNLLILPCVIFAGLLVSGCDDEPYGYSDDRPGYRSARTVDFYYTSGRPYSRSYGPLYHRDGRYYYSRGGTYVVYDQPTTVYRSGTRVVHRDVDVRHRDERYDDGRRGYYSSRRDVETERRYVSPVRRTSVYREEDRGDQFDRDYDRRDGTTRVRVIER
jgi:hypothetical protein